MKTYTQDEIAKNIDTHQKKLDNLILNRKELNKNIQSTKKQIEYWN
jgi:septal ring factor EnvC (AmiA/AmiB activator)